MDDSKLFRASPIGAPIAGVKQGAVDRIGCGVVTWGGSVLRVFFVLNGSLVTSQPPDEPPRATEATEASPVVTFHPHIGFRTGEVVGTTFSAAIPEGAHACFVLMCWAASGTM